MFSPSCAFRRNDSSVFQRPFLASWKFSLGFLWFVSSYLSENAGMPPGCTAIASWSTSSTAWPRNALQLTVPTSLQAFWGWAYFAHCPQRGARSCWMISSSLYRRDYIVVGHCVELWDANVSTGFCQVPGCQGHVLCEVVPELAKKEQSHVLMSTVPLSNRRISLVCDCVWHTRPAWRSLSIFSPIFASVWSRPNTWQTLIMSCTPRLQGLWHARGSAASTGPLLVQSCGSLKIRTMTCDACDLADMRFLYFLHGFFGRFWMTQTGWSCASVVANSERSRRLFLCWNIIYDLMGKQDTRLL